MEAARGLGCYLDEVQSGGARHSKMIVNLFPARHGGGFLCHARFHPCTGVR